MPAPKRFAALDTGFLLCLAVGDESCEAVIDWLSHNHIYPLVTGTVLQELDDIEREDDDPFNNANAVRVKESIATWGFLEIPLTPVENGVCKIIGANLIAKGLIPDECENDGLVVAEAASQSCILLVTFRGGLLAAPYESLKLMLIESDVSGLVIVSPEMIVEHINLTKGTTPSHAAPSAT